MTWPRNVVHIDNSRDSVGNTALKLNIDLFSRKALSHCKDSRTVCLYCSLDGDKIAEFVGYLHVRRLLACSSATCISVGYSTYMCQFSFNIKATLFVCSSLALNLLTTRLVLLLPVDLASFPNSFSRPLRLGPSLSNSAFLLSCPPPLHFQSS